MIDLIDLRIYGIALLVASIGFVTTGSHAALATLVADLDTDEAATASNDTTNMTIGSTHQTELQNMTSSMMTNSTS